MKKVKLALIGAGGIAQNQHIPNICRARNAELSVLCDLRRETVDQIGDLYGIEQRETDYRKVLANPDIDAVLIATREDSHVPLTLEALASGKHVYVEKPLAEDEASCNQVVEEQRKSGKLVAVGMNRRCAPAYLYADELLWKSGGPKNMFYRISDSYSLTWGKSFGAGNRVIHEVCHIFDILRFFARSEAVSIYCMSARDDDEQFCIKFESGAIATILSSGYVETDMPKEYFEAVAEKGGVTVDEFVEVNRYGFEDGVPTKVFAGHYHPAHDTLHSVLYEEMGASALRAVRRACWKQSKKYNVMLEQGQTDTNEFRELEKFVKQHAPLANYHMNKGWLDAVEHFCDCILDGRELRAANAFDALQAARLTQAALKSRESGQIVFL